MITDVNHLLDELAAGRLTEHRHPNVELKQSWSQEVGKKISSNANKVSQPFCWLAIGVTDRGTAAGRDEKWVKSTEAEISQHVNQYLDPSQACQTMEARETPGGWIIVLKVANPGIVVQWNKKAYKSAGGGTTLAEMEPDEVLELTCRLPGLHDYSRQRWNGPVDGQVVQQFCRRVTKVCNGSDLSHVDTLAPDAALDRLGIRATRAARLLFGDAAFRLIRYDAAGVPQRNDKIRPLYRLFDPQFYEQIEEWAGGAADRAKRVYPARAFQEGVANAVAHAAYFENDGDIIVEVYPDRLSVSNLCTPESAYFANRWFSRSRKTVNPLLMETLRLGRHVDELGRGKYLILSDLLTSGRPSPTVAIERAGQYNRWRLTLPSKVSDGLHLRLLEKLRDHYGEEQKALIGLALVLWRHKPVSELRKYADGELAPVFAAVLADIKGATFYREQSDSIELNRWARILLHEGLDSKAFNEVEEEHLYRIAVDKQARHGGTITPRDIRDLGQLGNAGGAKTISSKLLKKWEADGKLAKEKVGVYRFKDQAPKEDAYANILERLSRDQEQVPC